MRNNKQFCAVGAAIESLERRMMLSIDVSAAGNTLRIVGDGGDDWIYFIEDPAAAANKTLVISGTDVWAFPRIFAKIKVDLNAGDDHFLAMLASDLVGKKQTFNVSLGAGNDGASFSAPRLVETEIGLVRMDPDEADVINSSINFNVDGGAGDDAMSAGFSTISNSIVKLDFRGGEGAGRDEVHFFPSTVEPIQNKSQVQLYTALGEGDDSVYLFLDTPIRSGAKMTLDVNTEGGDDMVLYRGASGIANFQLTGGPPSALWSDVDLGSGNDLFRGWFDLGPETRITGSSKAQFAVHGCEGDDTILFNLHSYDANPLPIRGALEFIVTGGSGQDQIRVDKHDFLNPNGSSPGLIDVAANGRLRVIVDAGNQADNVLVNLETTPTSAGRYDLQLYGGGGNDVLALRFQNNGLHNPGRYPGASPLLDGGAGVDTWDVEGNVWDFISVIRAEIRDQSLV